MLIIERMTLPKPRRLWPGLPRIEGKYVRVQHGRWAIYVPSMQLKLLHSYRGYCHCVFRHAPSRTNLISKIKLTHKNKYNLEDWRKIYSKNTALRAAENYVCADRLYKAGIGPKPMDTVIVKRFKSYYDNQITWTCGMVVENLSFYPEKGPTTEAEIIAAGVAPDRIRSCVREQINGYVSDLNSVVGVMPINGDSEVKKIYEAFTTALDSIKPHCS